MDPLAFLEERDSLRRNLLIEIAQQWLARKRDLDQELADRIINSLGKALK